MKPTSLYLGGERFDEALQEVALTKKISVVAVVGTRFEIRDPPDPRNYEVIESFPPLFWKYCAMPDFK